jgi:hypothetical protein
VSTADHILDQIDSCLGDYELSDDAMRCAPDLPPLPAVRPRANGANILIGRLIERHGLSPEEARAAILAAERAQTGPHTELAAAEAQAVLDEMAAQFRAAFQPMIRRVADQFRQIKEAFEHLPEAVGCNDCSKPSRRRDRPAWQSPYGPAQRRR